MTKIEFVAKCIDYFRPRNMTDTWESTLIDYLGKFSEERLDEIYDHMIHHSEQEYMPRILDLKRAVWGSYSPASKQHKVSALCHRCKGHGLLRRVYKGKECLTELPGNRSYDDSGLDDSVFERTVELWKSGGGYTRAIEYIRREQAIAGIPDRSGVREAIGRCHCENAENWSKEYPRMPL